MYKFRSMVTNADELKKKMEAENERTGPLFKMSNDPRITRIGKIIRETSIDELPQLLNVLKGDMSLVGPRPALPEEEAVFDEELRDRFEVRPGITGLWQVEARSNAAFNAYRRLDLHYVENFTLWLDLRILLATAEQVAVSLALAPLRLLRRGAGTDGIAASPAPAGDARPPEAEERTAAAQLNGTAAPLARPVGSPVPLAGATAVPANAAEPFHMASITAEHRLAPLYSQLQSGPAASKPQARSDGSVRVGDQLHQTAPTADDTETDQMPAIRAIPARVVAHKGSNGRASAPNRLGDADRGKGRLEPLPPNGHDIDGWANSHDYDGYTTRARTNGSGPPLGDLAFGLPDDSRPLGSDEVTSQTPALGPVTPRRRRPPLEGSGRAQPQHRVRTRRGVHDIVDRAPTDRRANDDDPSREDGGH